VAFAGNDMDAYAPSARTTRPGAAAAQASLLSKAGPYRVAFRFLTNQ